MFQSTEQCEQAALFSKEDEEQQCQWDFPPTSLKMDHICCSPDSVSTNGDAEDSSDKESWCAGQSTSELQSSMDASPSPMHPPGVWVDPAQQLREEIVESHVTVGRSSRRRHRRRSSKSSAAEEQSSVCHTNDQHAEKPKRQENSPDERTTLVLKNIPPSCTTAMLVDMLNLQGFEGCYNFVYAPTDFRSLSAFGYGFVNLLSFDDAVRMMESLEGFDGWASTGVNAMEVCWSMPHQGLDLQIRRFQNSPVMHPSVPDEIKPMVFADGVRAPFPEPTKPLRKPRAREPKQEF